MISEKIIRSTLKKVHTKQLSLRHAFRNLKNLPYESLSFAKLDYHRPLRKGLVEAVFSPGKSLAQLIQISRRFIHAGQPLLITRLEKNRFTELKKTLPFLTYHDDAKAAFYINPKKKKFLKNGVVILTAGTSDIPVAEEAQITLKILGAKPEVVYDCGVAGIHRLMDHFNLVKKAKVIICIAGMDGALPSVVAGLTSSPVIAVPTSVGYGASFKGIAALLNMLNSCAQGVACVNIDNGFGAACFAYLILNQNGKRRKR